MKNLNRLLQKQISKPQTYQSLKSNPFPFLSDCNRLQIFQFIYQLQQQNQRLRGQIERKHPDKTLEEIIQKHDKIRIRRQMKAIQKVSIEKMEIEVRSKMSQLESLTGKNKSLEEETRMIQAQIQIAESQTLELQTKKRQKEIQIAIAQGKKSKENCSQIFKQLYGDVKNILEDSL